MKIIVTGATGMVGEGVMYQCLQSDLVEAVLVIGRRPCGHTHPKLREVLLSDLTTLDVAASNATGYDACFFCAGVSSVGKGEEEYTRLTYDLTMSVAQKLAVNNNGMVFCYVSGAGTDSSEKGKVMWARVKGRTENDLMKLSFRKVYAFRPAFMTPTKGLLHTLKLYKWMGWMAPLVRLFSPNAICTLADVGNAMINSVRADRPSSVVTVKDIRTLAGK